MDYHSLDWLVSTLRERERGGIIGRLSVYNQTNLQ